MRSADYLNGEISAHARIVQIRLDARRRSKCKTGKLCDGVCINKNYNCKGEEGEQISDMSFEEFLHGEDALMEKYGAKTRDELDRKLSEEGRRATKRRKKIEKAMLAVGGATIAGTGAYFAHAINEGNKKREAKAKAKEERSDSLYSIGYIMAQHRIDAIRCEKGKRCGDKCIPRNHRCTNGGARTSKNRNIGKAAAIAGGAAAVIGASKVAEHLRGKQQRENDRGWDDLGSDSREQKQRARSL
jgi:hypothetical protein